jgi:hypothetical protein
MPRMPAWVFLVLAAALALAIAVAAVAWADDQPAAPQPQMVRFVCHFIAFMPKDPAIIEGDGLHSFPSWEAACLNSRMHRDVTGAGGYRLHTSLADLAPQLGPLDALKGRDARDVADLMTRLDDRWQYTVLSLAGSGPVGRLLAVSGNLRPIPLRSAEGAEIGTGPGPADAEQFRVARIVRVDTILPNGYALLQGVATVACLEHMTTMEPDQSGPGERKLGVPCDEGGVGASVGPYTSAAGVYYEEAVWPGIICLETVDVGPWERGLSQRWN